MAHRVKCTYCGVIFDRDKEPFEQDGGRRYIHTACLKKRENGKTELDKDYEALQDYIKKIFNTDIINKKIIQQIKEYRETYNYTYSGMRGALIWWIEIKHETMDRSAGGIGIIPYIYDQAKEYYLQLDLARTINSVQDIKNYNPKEIIITINPPQNNYKPKLFNLDWEDN